MLFRIFNNFFGISIKNINFQKITPQTNRVHNDTVDQNGRFSKKSALTGSRVFRNFDFRTKIAASSFFKRKSKIHRFENSWQVLS